MRKNCSGCGAKTLKAHLDKIKKKGLYAHSYDGPVTRHARKEG